VDTSVEVRTLKIRCPIKTLNFGGVEQQRKSSQEGSSVRVRQLEAASLWSLVEVCSGGVEALVDHVA
jgi:hypothetical protein